MRDARAKKRDSRLLNLLFKLNLITKQNPSPAEVTYAGTQPFEHWTEPLRVGTELWLAPAGEARVLRVSLGGCAAPAVPGVAAADLHVTRFSSLHTCSLRDARASAIDARAVVCRSRFRDFPRLSVQISRFFAISPEKSRKFREFSQKIAKLRMAHDCSRITRARYARARYARARSRIAHREKYRCAK